MRHVVFIAVTVGFFGLAAAYIGACARIIGREGAGGGRARRRGRRGRARRGALVSADNVIGLVLAIVITGYLVVALLLPEKL